MPFTDDDWLTPPDVLEKFGRFDLDPCMSEVQPWQTAAHFYTKEQDGLKQRWFGRIWLNPPYSDMPPWIFKLRDHIAQQGTGMGLFNARTETEWFFDGIWKLADSVFFPERRFRFFRPDGSTCGSGRMGSVIAAYSEHDSAMLYGAGLDGKFVVLRFRLPVEIHTTWRRLVRTVMRQQGRVVTLEQLYTLLKDHPKAERNQHWKAQVRKQVQQVAEPVKRGQWELPL